MSRHNSSPVATSLAGMVFDSLEFARDERELSGDLPVAGLERLAKTLDTTGGDPGALKVSLKGRWDVSADGRAQPSLLLKVDGSLPMTCQRCLQPMDVPVAIDTRLLLISPGESWPDDLEEGAFDAIPADAATVLMDLVEDEALLALPFAPRHERCELPARGGDKQAASPFAALAQLKKKV